MAHYPPTRRPCTKMWEHTYFFVVIMVFMMVSQPAFAMKDIIHENKDRIPHRDEMDDYCRMAIAQKTEHTLGKFMSNKNQENKDKYIANLESLTKPSNCDTEERFKKIKQEMIDNNNHNCNYWILDTIREALDLNLETATEEKIKKALLKEENVKYIKQIVQVSKESAWMEKEFKEQFIGIAIRVSKQLQLQCEKYLEDWKGNVVKKTSELAQNIGMCSENKLYNDKYLLENQQFFNAALQFNKKADAKRSNVSNNDSNNDEVTDRKCCKYFTIVLCIIIIVIVVVILYSKNDEDEEKEEDEENPNTSADIEEGPSQDLGNSESIKHAIDNMNVVHKENKVDHDQIAGSHEKIDMDGLVNPNATVEEVHVSE